MYSAETTLQERTELRAIYDCYVEERDPVDTLARALVYISSAEGTRRLTRAEARIWAEAIWTKAVEIYDVAD